MSDLVFSAIGSLRPGTAFSIDGDNIESLVWITEDVEPLTTAEVQAEVERLEQAEAGAAAAKEAARASAIAKLSALGLDADEVSALLSG